MNRKDANTVGDFRYQTAAARVGWPAVGEPMRAEDILRSIEFLVPPPQTPYHIERCFHRWRYIRKDIDADHVRNFLDAVKSRQDPIELVEIGHSTANLCILGNMALILKRKFTWDPVAERPTRCGPPSGSGPRGHSRERRWDSARKPSTASKP